MPTREYTGTFRMTLLHEELTTIPGMRTTNEYGFPIAAWNAAYDGQTLTIVFPEAVSPSLVDQAIANHNPAGSTKEEQAISQIRQMAASAVGVRLQDLTAAQVKALLAVLLYKAGAIDRDTLTIRPLKDW